VNAKKEEKRPLKHKGKFKQVHELAGTKEKKKGCFLIPQKLLSKYMIIPTERFFFNNDRQSELDATSWEGERKWPSDGLEELGRNLPLGRFRDFRDVPIPSLLSCSLSLPSCQDISLQLSTK